ncbi:MAG TPA: twin transmembrane helix small protein [Ottowia sp.]|uniref:twin transmembrane helix small protein n=1 Tax=Ottowia sp. TaxID=1898956 RepID=UPI002C87AE49|nr:twin transmembrane helix small protein [Ottowia sp.]HMN22304.1 twin transmembrane helix small protein [Ottowia sp.]
MKQWLVALAFVGILASLASALVFMMRSSDEEGQEDSDRRRADRMFRSLALRVGLSVLLFLCILLAWKLGWIQPTGLGAEM